MGLITEEHIAATSGGAAQLPRISVCIVASRPILLDRCLASLQRQLDAPQFEVLVSFEQGDVHHAYILGGLWNGKDAPPRKNDQVVIGGKVQQRIIRSRLGHTITLDDSDDQPSITITDKTGKNTIRLESSSNNLSIAVDGDVSLKAKGTVSIEGQSIHVKATNDLKLKGASADVEAQAGLTLKGGTADLEAQGPTTIKGATVSIN